MQKVLVTAQPWQRFDDWLIRAGRYHEVGTVTGRTRPRARQLGSKQGNEA
jgi:hypothetical protein